MGDENDNKKSNFEREFSEKTKDFGDKAETYFEEAAEKIKSSDAFGKISGVFEKFKDKMESKSEEFQSGEMGAKFDEFKTNAGDHAGELVKKVREAGLKIGDQVEDAIDALKGKKDRTKNENGSGI